VKPGPIVGAVVALAAVAGGAWFFMKGTRGGAEIEYRYAAVEKRELMLSTSSTGVLVPLTRVDVKSKAGGKVVKLAVLEGSVVKQGDLVAEIDPRDVQATLDQAQADVRQAKARVDSAKTSLELEEKSAETRVQNAEVALNLANIRLKRAEQDAVTQPKLTAAAIANAEANLNTQKQAMSQLKTVTIPTRKRQAETSLNKAKVDRDNAKSDLDRQTSLFNEGYVAKTRVEQARSTYESAVAAFEVAQVQFDTLQSDLNSQVESQQSRIDQAESTLSQARANAADIDQAKRTVDEAKKTVQQATIALKEAKDARINVRSRRIDIESADAQAVRSGVTMDNAREQLAETSVLAPRDGVVTKKYLEEGTIIPPGTSTFAEGTSIVEISDVSTMFVECQVDEADIATLKLEQKALIIVEAYPGQKLTGQVDLVYPAAESEGAVTTIKVRVKVDTPEGDAFKEKPLRPGMNATVEFLQFEIPETLVVPSQAVKKEGEKSYVLVKSADPLKPTRREVQTGKTGNDGIEILGGVNAGEEVVVAEIDLSAMRDRQERMLKADQAGGLGSNRAGGPSKSRAGQ
jgi:RND family efflux transporter MFP subunit